jgi:hypothetical protein
MRDSHRLHACRGSCFVGEMQFLRTRPDATSLDIEPTRPRGRQGEARGVSKKRSGRALSCVLQPEPLLGPAASARTIRWLFQHASSPGRIRRERPGYLASSWRQARLAQSLSGHVGRRAGVPEEVRGSKKLQSQAPDEPEPLHWLRIRRAGLIECLQVDARIGAGARAGFRHSNPTASAIIIASRMSFSAY